MEVTKVVTLSKDMEVGVLEIDTQHMELVNRLNALVSIGHDAASREETQKTLDMLEVYIVKHFTDEEELQRKNNYPEYESHKKLHQVFIEEFEKLKKEFDVNGNSLKFTMDLNNSLINWIVKHIKSADVELGRFLKNNG
jgi:hemerythrin